MATSPESRNPDRSAATPIASAPDLRLDFVESTEHLAASKLRERRLEEPRYAAVTATAPLAVRFWSDDVSVVEVDRLRGYTPTAGDTVLMMKVGARWLVVDAVA